MTGRRRARGRGWRCRRAALLVGLLLAVDGPFAAAQPVQLHGADGVPIAATLHRASDLAPAVVLVHMFTRTRDDWRRFAERLQASGITALAIDLRGHGGSGGASTPAPAMALDVQAGIDYLAAQAGARRIAVIGASLGATAALMASADDPRVGGVALVSPAADYRGVRLDAALRKYGDRPLLLVASSEDPYALRTVRGMVSAPATARQVHLSPVAGHGTQLPDRDPDVTAALVDWLRRTLLS